MSCIFAAVMVSLIKTIGVNVNSSVIVAGRCIIGLLIVSPMLAKHGPTQLNSSQLRLHLIRGVFVAVAINLGFYSLTILPITTVTILFFTAPLFVTLLAGPMLGEKVGWRRFLATSLGFVGAMVVINPTATVFDIKLLVPVVSSAFFSVSLILNKKLSKTDPPWVLMIFMFTCTLVLTLPFAAVNWKPLESGELIMIAVIAGFATTRTYCDIRGYSLGDVSFVAPFQYLRILFVGFLAYFLFAEVLKLNEWIGTLIIIFSTLYVAHREYTAVRRAKISPI